MRWTLRYRGFDRAWQEVKVEADSEAQAREKLNAMGYRMVFSFSPRDVRLEADFRDVRFEHAEEAR